MPGSFVQIALGALFIFNDPVKAFVWSPHTQMFNIMLPLFCVWCFVGVVEKNYLKKDSFYSLVIGRAGSNSLCKFFSNSPVNHCSSNVNSETIRRKRSVSFHCTQRCYQYISCTALCVMVLLRSFENGQLLFSFNRSLSSCYMDERSLSP